TAVVVANMIGTGIFTSTGYLAAELGSSWLILAAWTVGGLTAMAGAACYAELATTFPESGGEVVYLRELYGPLPAFLSGWLSFVVGFSAPTAAEVWVLELGSSEPGEIGRLTEIARPDDAVVTTVGPAHLEGLGDLDGVLEEKLALVSGASPDGMVVVGERPAELGRATGRIRPDRVVAGLGADCDYRPDGYETGPDHASFTRGGVTARLAVGGLHHVRDALIAAAVSEALGTPPHRVAEGLARFRPLALRSVVRQAGELTVVADCYNANPESFDAAIEFCAGAFPGRRLVAVVGTMLELGHLSADAHRSVARMLLEAGFALVVATGEFAGAFESLGDLENGRRVVPAEGADEAATVLRERLRGDEVVLVKGSRGVRLESVVDRLVGPPVGGEG
ncbi:MAG: amino acid permease, partial [Gemmatimonadota bacterium]